MSKKKEEITSVILYGVGTGVAVYAGYFTISSVYNWFRNRSSAAQQANEKKVQDLTNVKLMISKVKKIYFGYGAIYKISSVLTFFRSKKIRKILIICSHSAFNRSGAWPVVRRFLKNKFTEIQYKRIIQFRYGHTSDIIDRVVMVGRKFGAQAVIGIGGGTPLDATKVIAVLLHPKNKGKTAEYICHHLPEQIPAVPIVCINTSTGSGSESNKYSLIQKVAESSGMITPKRSYSNWRAYPMYTLNDPELTFSLSRDQTVGGAIHALGNAIEAATSIVATRYSQTLAKKVVKYIVQYLPQVIDDPHDREGRYFLMLSGMLAGMALDEGMAQLGHGLVRVLTSFKSDLGYGQAYSILLPSIVKNTFCNDKHLLHDILEPLLLFNRTHYRTSKKKAKAKRVESEIYMIRTGRKFAQELEKYFVMFEMDEKLYDVGVKVEDVPILLEMSNEESVQLFLMQSSICVGKNQKDVIEIAKKIFMESFRGID